ncbi:MAG: nucleotidyltransferase domain-containing protein [bacterium]
MTDVPSHIIELVHKLIEESKKFNINISEVVLFGSQAKGIAHEWSDIDLAVVSQDFAGNFFDDNDKIRRAKLNTSYDLEIHPYRPEDFTEENPFVQEILSHGIRIV